VRRDPCRRPRTHRRRRRDRRVLQQIRGSADFAEVYGDQIGQDHDLLVNTIKGGNIAAVEGV
jgi:hypothetical protein